MTDTETPDETPDEVTELVDAPQPERDDARERAHKCSMEIAAVLDKHRCRIMPRIDPQTIEPVGLAGDKIQIAATFWIAPVA